MANQPEQITYDPGVYQLETVDQVLGGIGGISNAPLLNLANRTAWLKQQLNNLQTGAAQVPGSAPLNSPVFTGSPTCPTPPPGDYSLKIANTTFVDVARYGIATVNVAGNSNVVLTQAQWGQGIIILTGTLTGNISVVFPVNGNWIVSNQSTGAFTITCKTAAGTGWALTQGRNTILWGDGTNIQLGHNDYMNAALVGVPTAPTAAAGTSTTQIASTAFVMNALVGISQPYALDTGTVNHLVATLTGVTFNTGSPLTLSVKFTNTGSADLNVNATGTLPIKAPDGSGLQPGDLLAGQDATFRYHSTYWLYDRVTGTQSRTGGLQIATAAQVAALADATKALTPGLLGNAFAALVGANGYLQIPTANDVLKIQWGSFFPTGGLGYDVAYTISWPDPFQTACLWAMVCPANSTASGSSGQQTLEVVSFTSATGTFYSDFDGSAGGHGVPENGFYFLAIGH